MRLLDIQCRHHLKKFQHACLKHTRIYTRLSPYKPLSQIPTANYPLNSMAELSSTKNTTRTVTSSVSPLRGHQRNTFSQPQSSQGASIPFHKKIIIERNSPATQFGILAGVFLRHKARSLGFRVLPDGYVRVSEMLNHSQHFRAYSFYEFENFVKNDPMNRFEMSFQSDMMVDGNLKKVWWVRAKYGHTMPGVNSGTRRIIHIGKLGTVYYVTLASNWERIREHGIPQNPDNMIKLFNLSPFNNLFLDDVPADATVLRISIDPIKAVSLGVKFFHTKQVQLVASGGWNHTIPLQAFKTVVALQFNKETLK